MPSQRSASHRHSLVHELSRLNLSWCRESRCNAIRTLLPNSQRTAPSLVQHNSVRNSTFSEAVASRSSIREEVNGLDEQNGASESTGHQEAALPAKGIVEESMELLEWPSLCKQVAAFAQTSSTAQHIAKNFLAMGKSEVGLVY